jgi:RimJ/RimL family protein N-acetyltransferase
MISLVPFEPYIHMTSRYSDALNSPQARFLWTGEEKWDRSNLQRWCKEVLADPNQRLWAIMDDDRHIGNIKASFDHKNRSVNYGRLLWESGAGKGTEALIAMIDLVFSDYPAIEYITDMAASNNPASIISNLKAGMRIRGIWENKLCIGGKRVDGIAVGITREEWESL